MSPTFTPLVVARAVLRRPASFVRQWSVESQARSRRNAMIANSALTERRVEREDVEQFLRSLGRGGSGRITA